MTSLSELLIEHLAKKGEKRERTGAAAFSGSTVGECPRKLAYLLHYPEKAAPVSAQVMARFALGDDVHTSVASLLKEAGARVVDTERIVEIPIELTREQALMSAVNFPTQTWTPASSMFTLTLPGHIDVVLEEDGREIPCEVKSMKAWPWKIAAGLLRPRKGEQIVSHGYIAQLLAYIHALRAPYGRFLFRCVEPDAEAEKHPTYPFLDLKWEWDELEWRGIEYSVLSGVCSTPTSLPDRPYGPVPEILRGRATGRRVAPYPCSYCSFLGECFPDARLDPEAERLHTYVFPEEDPEPVPVSLDPAF